MICNPTCASGTCGACNCLCTPVLLVPSARAQVLRVVHGGDAPDARMPSASRRSARRNPTS